MCDVFISYKREDTDRVGILQSALTKAGLNVWWDRDIAIGEHWRQRILRQLESAKCVIVVWSNASTRAGAEFVIDEAARAQKRGILLPVRIDEVSPPLGFGEQQALDLIGWHDDGTDSRREVLLSAVNGIVHGKHPAAALRFTKNQRRSRRKWRILSASAALGVVLLFVAVFVVQRKRIPPTDVLPTSHVATPRLPLNSGTSKVNSAPTTVTVPGRVVAPSAAPPANPNANLNGTWRGSYQRQLIDGNDSIVFSVDLSFDGANFTGRSYEFKVSGVRGGIKGTVAGDAVRFIRTYETGINQVRHTATFTGKLDRVSEMMEGTWSKEASNGDDPATGTFLLRRSSDSRK